MIIRAEDAVQGTECGCCCPACDAPLKAVKGQRTQPYFIHQSQNGCEYGHEASLHLAAADILRAENRIWIPAVLLCFNSYKPPIILSDAKEIWIDTVGLEKRFGRKIPEVVIESGASRLFLRIKIQDSVNKDSFEMIKSDGQSTLEIDISHRRTTITPDMLRNLLVNNEYKHWLHNSSEELYREKYRQAAEKKPVLFANGRYYVNSCPKITREQYRRVDVKDLCQDCEYCFSCGAEEVLCTGKMQISTPEDFKRSEIERNKWEELRRGRRKQYADQICPLCENKLRPTVTEKETLWRCKDYPRCHYIFTPPEF